MGRRREGRPHSTKERVHCMLRADLIRSEERSSVAAKKEGWLNVVMTCVWRMGGEMGG